MNTTNTYPAILNLIIGRQELSAEQIEFAFAGILKGIWTPAQTAAFLIAMKIKGETPLELAAAAAQMRSLAVPVKVDEDSIIDTCGTGGDGAGLFNISTAASFVAVGAGARVAKHGNRALSSASGSADVLVELGIPIDLPPDKIADMIMNNGFGFMFAPNHHPAMRHAAAVRKELGVRTMFNLLGPLANPARARRQVVGVFSPTLLLPYAETLAAAGATRAMTVHGDGLDEITIAAPSDIAEVNNGAVIRTTISPQDFGLSIASLDTLRVSSAVESAMLIRKIFAGENGPARDIVTLNAAAALVVADIADSFADGVLRAQQSLDSYAAQNALAAAIAAAA